MQNEQSHLDMPLDVYVNEFGSNEVDTYDVSNGKKSVKSDSAKISKQAISDERALIGAFLAEENNRKIPIREIVLKVHQNWLRMPVTNATLLALKFQAQQAKSFSISALSLYSQIKRVYKGDEQDIEDVISSDLELMQKEWGKRTAKINEDDKQEFIASLIEAIQDRYKQITLNDFSKKLPQLLKSDSTEKDKFRRIKQAISVMEDTFDYSKDRILSLSTVAKAILDSATERAAQADPSRIIGYSTGYPVVDEELSGICNGKFYLVVARPSMGKTTFALNVMYNLAKNNIKSVFFSYEMSKEQVVRKLLGLMTRINPRRLELGDLSADEWIRFTKAVEEIDSLPIEIYDLKELGSNDVSLMVERCRELRKQGKLDVVFIDYVQLMTDLNFSKSDPIQVASSVSVNIQQCSRSMNIPFVAVAQLNREIEKRKDKRPQLSDIKGSGSLEQDADVIIFLHRDEYYSDGDETPKHSNLTSIIFAKNRDGEKDKTVSLQMNGAIGLFENVAGLNMLEERP